MTLTDENHDLARFVKDIEERVSDLEENDRGAITPNPLFNQTDQVGLGDAVAAVSDRTIETARWDETGWRTSAWGHND